LELMLSRLWPNTLYSEAVLAALRPSVPSLGPILPIQLQGAVFGAPLPLGISLVDFPG
jgi:ABC-2 type transport system permease protein